jgi:hypothetical protein
MAIVLKEVQELEKIKSELEKDALNVSSNPDYTYQEKQQIISKITDQIYDINQEIIRLKKQPVNVEVIESNKSIIFLAVGIVAIFLLTNKKGKK